MGSGSALGPGRPPALPWHVAAAYATRPLLCAQTSPHVCVRRLVAHQAAEGQGKRTAQKRSDEAA